MVELPPERISATRARDQLGTLVRGVYHHGRAVELTVNTRPAGALVPVLGLARAHLAPGQTEHPVRQARRDWARLRMLAEDQGPQAVVDLDRGETVALVGPDHARLLLQGRPVLDSPTLHFDGHRLRTSDGSTVPPGVYSYAGGVLHVHDEEIQ